jgi:hypothetical protein
VQLTQVRQRGRLLRVVNVHRVLSSDGIHESIREFHKRIRGSEFKGNRVPANSNGRFLMGHHHGHRLPILIEEG